MDSPSPLSGETGAVGPGPRERPVVQAGAGALSTAGSPCPALPAASRSCTFPVPTGGHAGSHPASPAWGTWETSIRPSNLMLPLPEAAPLPPPAMDTSPVSPVITQQEGGGPEQGLPPAGVQHAPPLHWRQRGLWLSAWALGPDALDPPTSLSSFRA